MSEIATQDVARARAAMIRAGIQNYLHTLAHIAAAYQQRDWKALGYDSWDGYVDGEYSEHRLKLSPEHRQKAVAELRLAGMSQRAIGSALGISAATVNRDLGTVADETVPDRITGVDGREQPATRPDRPSATGEADARLDDAAMAPAVDVEALTGVAPVGAGDDSTGDDLGPVDATGGECSPSPVAAPAVSEPETDTAGVTRPRPPAWDPDERRQHEADVRRAQDIEAARHTSRTVVPDFLSAVSTIVTGSRYGEPGLVTKDMIADLRKGIDLLEGEL